MSAEGFEPSTHALEGRCSIQLSYAPILEFGAGDRTRTYNLLITSQLLYQLSHTNVFSFNGGVNRARTCDLSGMNRTL